MEAPIEPPDDYYGMEPDDHWDACEIEPCTCDEIDESRKIDEAERRMDERDN